MRRADEALQPIPAQAGIGLRSEHFQAVVDSKPSSAFLELHSENFFSAGPARDVLDQLRDDYPMSFHGIGLSLGSCEALDQNHLSQLKQLVDHYQPELISEHLSWSRLNGRYYNDLFPLPYTEESLRLMVQRIGQTQDTLGRRLLLENVSSYLEFSDSTIAEWDFLTEVARVSGCGILLDINNIYVNARNHGFDPYHYINAMRAQDIGELHLAGHSRRQVDGVELLIDTHDTYVCEDVWHLYRHAVQKLGAKPTLIEWDAQLPPLTQLLGEAEKADRILYEVAHDCVV